MPEPLAESYLVDIRTRLLAVPRRRFDEIYATADGELQGFGPFPFVEPWDYDELVPAVELCRHARRDLSALVGEVGRLQRRVDTLEAQAATVQVRQRLSGVARVQ